MMRYKLTERYYREHRALTMQALESQLQLEQRRQRDWRMFEITMTRHNNGQPVTAKRLVYGPVVVSR
jgi:hypothetical protein